jgi:lysophospholipase L1-like esterase
MKSVTSVQAGDTPSSAARWLQLALLLSLPPSFIGCGNANKSTNSSSPVTGSAASGASGSDGSTAAHDLATSNKPPTGAAGMTGTSNANASAATGTAGQAAQSENSASNSNGGSASPKPDSSGGAGSGSIGMAGSGAPADSRPPCISKPGEEVVIIGDSYVTGFSSPPLQPELANLVPDASSYPNYAGAGCSMASGGICTGLYGNVPDQFTAATGEHSGIKLVLMNGGGNDVLLPAAGSPDCKNEVGSSKDPGCTAIVKLSLDTATSLIMHMADVGVRDVVFFFYPHIPSVDGGLGGTNANEILDYAYPTVADSCKNANAMSGGKLTCHFIDLRQPFADTGSITGAGPWTNISDDGVHPTDAGQKVMAAQIVSTMKSACLGQPASSNCCAP